MEKIPFKAPFLNDKMIHKKADSFREVYSDNSIPIKIEEIAEFDLDMEIIGIKNLRQDFDIDSFLSFSLKQIYVDKDILDNPKQENRLRFSIAHEIGHFIMHGDILKKYHIKNLKDYSDWLNSIPESQYSWIEHQAYEFAGRLLVPPNNFIEIFQEVLLLQEREGTSARYEFSRRFKVSYDVIDRRILKDCDIKAYLREDDTIDELIR